MQSKIIPDFFKTTNIKTVKEDLQSITYLSVWTVWDLLIAYFKGTEY